MNSNFVKRFLTILPILALGFSVPSQAVAKTINVNCNSGKTIQGAVERANPGDTINVSGTCGKNIVIVLNRITLDGGGTATIDAPDDSPGIHILGSNVAIRGFTIEGGSDGIQIARGGSAVIEDNDISGASNNGIAVLEASYGRIIDNTITGNEDGVRVEQASAAHIINNVVSGNFFDGIRSSKGSHTHIDGGNVITGNEIGIRVSRQSHADLSTDGVANVIEGNSEWGILCNRHASIDVKTVQDFGGGNPGSPPLADAHSKDVSDSDCSVKGDF